MTAEERLARVNEILDSFTSHGTYSDGERWITVHDHLYQDSAFYDDLFEALGRFDASPGSCSKEG